MQREIKFRSWSKENKSWFVSNCYYCGSINYNSDSDYETMLYTGTKDVNNKEIYEGDIVIIDEDKSNPSLIEWDGIKYWQLDCFVKEQISIIGNIYETPELLDTAKRLIE